MSKLDASRPTTETGRQYHIDCAKGDMPRYVLLPGDPFRVPVIGETWDSYREVAHHREYRTARGMYGDAELGACSTGIGGPSTEIAVNELAAIGCDTMLRVGTTGALPAHIRCGDMIITSGSYRMDGTSDRYVDRGYPAVADYEVVMALMTACERLGVTYHVGVTASVGSFYAGQARPSFDDYLTSDKKHLIEDLMMARVTNFEMESGTLLTLAGLFGLRAGAVCAVIANRTTNEWHLGDSEKQVARVGTEALGILAEWDRRKNVQNRTHLLPSLLSASR
ncbi:nucleoside phosphorylase [Salinispira pacifica]